MQAIRYNQQTLQEELLQILKLMFEQAKKFTYKYHYILGYF
ncbi:hypothetical protein [Malaciobacter mytili]|nr:hypothetical protein [Malaciobacter mytili]